MPPTPAQTAQTQAEIDYYANLLPAQFRAQPNAYATIETLAALALMPQGGNVVVDPGTGDPVFDNGELVVDGPYGEIMPLALADAFDVTVASGQQLQYLAQVIGAVNYGYTLSGQFVTLTDSDFRLLLQAAGARNFIRATGAAIDAFMADFFAGVMTVKDELNMRITFTYLAELGTKLWAELFITQGLLPRPLGVAMSGILIGPGPFYGCRTYLVPPGPNVRPVCTYTAPVTSSDPVLLYSDCIIAGQN